MQGIIPEILQRMKSESFSIIPARVYQGDVELQILDSVTEITFVRCIEILVTDMRRDTYIHAHKDHKETCRMA